MLGHTLGRKELNYELSPPGIISFIFRMKVLDVMISEDLSNSDFLRLHSQ